MGELDATAASAFELGFIGSLNVQTRAGAAEAEAIVDGALLAIEKAFRFLTGEPEDRNPFPTGTVSTRSRSQIANFQAALGRLQAAGTGSFPPIFNIFG